MRIRTLAAALAALGMTGAQAAGFALIEQNASGLGNAYAGQAASAQDASTIFFNPAGMTQVQGRQLVLTGHAIRPSAQFSNGASVAAPIQALGSESGDAGGWAGVPNVYYLMDVRPGMKFGLGINAPFGLSTKYDSDWMGRFQAVKSDMKTVNINPSLAFSLDEHWSLGVGLSAQQIKAELTSMTNYGALLATPNLQGLAVIEGDDWGWSYNLGLLYAPSTDLRVGLNYRAAVDYQLEGTVAFQDRPLALAGALPDGPVTADVKLPGNVSMSLFKALNDRWDVLADLTWTNWGVFERLVVQRTSGAVINNTTENWRNAWRYSVGANYHSSDRLTWRFGVAYDESPVPDAFRTPRIPDEDRIWLSVGGQYCMSKPSCIDFGYTHIFVDDASINSSEAGKGTLNGSYDNAVDILSVQYTHSF